MFTKAATRFVIFIGLFSVATGCHGLSPHSAERRVDAVESEESVSDQSTPHRLVKQTNIQTTQTRSETNSTVVARGSRQERERLQLVVRESFLATHDGWSTDEVLLNDKLNRRFLQRCQAVLPEVKESDLNWTLLNLRKAGRLGKVVTRRRHDPHDDYLHAAEIAARLIYDKHQLTMDRVLCDPVYRAEFDRMARSIVPDVSPYLLRKAALRLRKSRQLRPELVLRVADWGKQVLTLSAQQIMENPDAVPSHPGVYIFRDRTGYLYVGESQDLKNRVLKHLDRSDRNALATYLSEHGVQQIVVEIHAFDPDSKAKRKMIRRAYESELIRSRNPRLNIQP